MTLSEAIFVAIAFAGLTLAIVVVLVEGRRRDRFIKECLKNQREIMTYESSVTVAPRPEMRELHIESYD